MKVLAFILFITFAFGTFDKILSKDQCPDLTYELYNYQCITTQCYESLDKLVKSGPSATTAGSINPALYLEVKQVTEGLQVNIYQKDDEDQPLEQDGCVSVNLYQKEGEKVINAGWPEWSSKTYDASIRNTVRSFIIKIEDLTKCYAETSDDFIKYFCYFQLTFELKNIIQAEYFFQIEQKVKTQTKEMLDTEFVKFTQKEKGAPLCYDVSVGETECVETVETKLSFCKDKECTEIVEDPSPLYVNKIFWVKYEILDERFSDWTLNFKSATYTAPGFDLSAKVEEGGSGKKEVVYGLKVSAAMEQVSVTVSSYLTDPNGNRRLLQESDQFQGATYDKPITVVDDSKDTPANGILVTMMTILLIGLLL